MAVDYPNPLASGQRVKIAELLGTGNQTGLSVELDATVQEDHDGTSVVTEFPVEEGADITDHSRPQPREFTLHGFVTGTPVSLTNIAQPNAVLNARGKSAWKLLDGWRVKGVRVKVVTTFYTYNSVVITKISVPRNFSNTDGVEMTISFREIYTVQSQSVPKPQRTMKPESETVGKQVTTPTNPSQSDANIGILKTFSNAVGTKLGLPHQ